MEKKNSSKFNLSRVIIFILVVALVYLVYLVLRDDTVYTFDLEGDNPFYLIQGDNYVEPGFKAYDEEMNEVTEKVKVKNDINNNVVGEYYVKYKIGQIEVKRKVIVTDTMLFVSLKIDNEELTNVDVTISYQVSGKAFEKLLLPDGVEVERRDGVFKASTNGEYRFKAYNSDGEVYEEVVEIKNIDKDPPVGNCTATIDKTQTEIIVSATDDSEIVEYDYLDNGESIIKDSQSTYTHNAKMSKKISVAVTDKAKNAATFNCSVTDNTIYPALLPDSSDNVIFKGETDTLKVYVIKRSSYYLTRIWVENPYEQLNKFDSPEYGKNLYKPDKLLETAMNTNNLTNKLLLGFNASGFYLKNTFDAYSVSRYPAYDRTSVGSLVITNGKVIRNAYDKAVKTWYIMGINPDNQMVIFEDKKTESSADIIDKQKWANDVINSKIRNTYTFAAPLIQNGVKTGITTSMPGGFTDSKGLQMICQINDNNFVLFTSSSSTRNKGMDDFLSMGCQTATNLDGGGSIALMYKDANSTTITKVIGGGRALPEVAYFSE